MPVMNTFKPFRILPAIAALSLLLFGHAFAAVLGTWPVINMGKPSKLFISGIAYGNGLWVAVGQGGYIATSTDGVAWTRRSAGISRDFNDVVFSNGRFIAVCKAPDTGSGAKIWVSSTGATWAFRNTDVGLDTISVGLHSVATDGAGNLIAVGGFGWVTRSFDNGESWHVLQSPGKFTSVSLYGVGYGNGVWIATQNGTGIYRSTDGGANWTSVSTNMGGTHVAFGNNRWLIAGNNNNRLYWSANGQSWKEAKSSVSDGGGTYFQFPKGCVFRDGLFVAVTEYGVIWTSENGREFRRWQAAGLDPDAWCIAASDRMFVAAGGDFKAKYGVGWISPPWMRARLGSSWDYPYTLFDSEDGPVRRIGLPQYRVNTSSLNLLLEGTLFNMKTTGAPVDLRLVYNSSPVKDSSTAIGLFGKNWRMRYESVIGAFGTEAMVITGGGRSLMFSTPNGEDLSTATPGSPLTLLPPDGIFDELKYFGPGQYFEYKEKDTKRVNRYGVSDAIGAVWRLTRITDRNGQQVNLSVDGTNGRIASITDPSSRTVSFAYDTTANLCTQITVPDGRTVKFQYDSHKNLIKMTDMAGYIGLYEYDTMGYLENMQVEGRATTFAYADRPGYEDKTSAQDNAGDKVLNSVKDATGGVTTYAVLPNEGGVKRTDARGKVTTFKSQKGQTASVVDPLGKSRQMEYSTAKLPASFTNAGGKVTKYEYDTRGNLVKTTDALGNITTYTYDSNNNLSTHTDALNQVTSYLYDASERMTRVTTPGIHQTNLTYYGNGRIHVINDARDDDTTFYYNGNGDLTSTVDQLGNNTQFGYDSTGRATSSTDARGKTKTFSYDGDDRLLITQFTSAPGTPQTANTYDAFGQTLFTNELGQTTHVVRNELGFPLTITDPLGNATATVYDADNNPVQITDAQGHITKTTYDDAGRPLVMTDPAGKVLSNVYDANGNLISLADKNTNKTLFAYDANNRLLTTTDPLGKKVMNTRDVLGRVSVITNARGQGIRFTFDGEGRITKKEHKEDAAPLGAYVTEATMTYDANGNVTQRVDDWGTSTYTYDLNDQVSSIGYPSGKNVSFTYDAGGQVKTISYPGGLVATYSYDDFNSLRSPTASRSGSLVGESEKTSQVTSIQLARNSETAAINFTYDAAGRLMAIDRPGAVADTTCTYDSAGRMTSLNHMSGATDRYSRIFGRDATGNIISEETSGNLSLQPGTPETATLSYNKLNEVIKRNTASYAYDADGNLTTISGGLLTATYTPENRLTQLSRLIAPSVTQTVANVYDGNGLRVKRTVNGTVVTQFHYGPDDKLLFTTDGAGNVQTCYVWNGKVLAAMTVGSTLSTDIRYFLLDHRGSTAAVFNPAGEADSYYTYQPFGATNAYATGGSADPGLFSFAGGLGVQDEGYGLFLMKNRFYDATTGRFLQRDPSGLTGSINLFAYANANPFMFMDPNGTDSIGSWLWWGASKTAQIGLSAVAYAGTSVAVAGSVTVSLPAAVAAGLTWTAYEAGEYMYTAYQQKKIHGEALKSALKKKEAADEINKSGDVDKQLDSFFEKEEQMSKDTKDALKGASKAAENGVELTNIPSGGGG